MEITAATGIKRRKRLPITDRKAENSLPLRNNKSSPDSRETKNGRKEMKDVHNGIATTVNALTTTSPNLREINLLKMTSLLKNKTKTLRYIILLFIVSALGACDKQTVYHAFQSIPQEGWKRQDTLLFNVAVPDSQTYYKLIVEIRNRSTYPYQNINLSVCYDSPELKKLQTDTLTAVLADKEGIWKGDGWGGLYQSAFPAGNIKIGKPGDYLFKVAYTLPDSLLPGINDVGIKLQR